MGPDPKQEHQPSMLPLEQTLQHQPTRPRPESGPRSPPTGKPCPPKCSKATTFPGSKKLKANTTLSYSSEDEAGVPGGGISAQSTSGRRGGKTLQSADQPLHTLTYSRQSGGGGLSSLAGDSQGSSAQSQSVGHNPKPGPRPRGFLGRGGGEIAEWRHRGMETVSHGWRLPQAH